ncbi:unnamed protein product, partial [Rotaria sp. Silwood1]
KSNQSIELNDIEELYERALSIRSSYPCLLELKLKESVINEQNKLIEQLPTEIWLSIFKHIDKQDIQNLTFAFPDFQSLKTIWENEELKKFEKNLFREKFIPTIVNQYFDQPLFCFVDSNFFFQHIDQCCRIAAIYAFFLLGHEKDSRTYTIHYDRNTQAVYLLSRFRFKTKTISDLNDIKSDSSMNVDNEEHEVYEQYYSQYEKEKIMTKILREIIDCDQLFDPDKIDNRVYHWRNCKYDYDDILAYRKNLLKHIEEDWSTSRCRMLSARNVCNLKSSEDNWLALDEALDLRMFYNHLIFDFDTHSLILKRLPDGLFHCL